MRFSDEAMAGQSEDVTRLAQEISDQMDTLEKTIVAVAESVVSHAETEALNAKILTLGVALQTGTIEERNELVDAMLALVPNNGGGDPLPPHDG